VKARPAKVVLLVDADSEAVRLLGQAFEHEGGGHTMLTVSTLEHAEDYVSGDPPWADRTKHPIPDLVLVDLALTGTYPTALLRKLGQGTPLLLLARPGDPRLLKLPPDRYVEKPRTLGAAVVLLRALFP